jgi:hypothetical protein
LDRKWVGLRSGLDAVVKRKNSLYYSCRKWNPKNMNTKIKFEHKNIGL